MKIKNAKNCQIAEQVNGDALFGYEPKESETIQEIKEGNVCAPEVEIDGVEDSQLLGAVAGNLYHAGSKQKSVLHLDDDEKSQLLFVSLQATLFRDDDVITSITQLEAVRCVFNERTDADLSRSAFIQLVTNLGLQRLPQGQLRGINNVSKGFSETPTNKWLQEPKLTTEKAFKNQYDAMKAYSEELELAIQKL